MRTTTRHTGRIERHRPGAANDPINKAAFAWRKAYEAACKHDGIPIDAKFAVFATDNPFARFVNAAFAEYCARRREYAAGGYVGLEIGK